MEDYLDNTLMLSLAASSIYIWLLIIEPLIGSLWNWIRSVKEPLKFRLADLSMRICGYHEVDDYYKFRRGGKKTTETISGVMTIYSILLVLPTLLLLAAMLWELTLVILALVVMAYTAKLLISIHTKLHEKAKEG